MANSRVADLPEGSVVAKRLTAWIKTNPVPDAPWQSTNGSYVTDATVDDALARGAKVLRVGKGEEG